MSVAGMPTCSASSSIERPARRRIKRMRFSGRRVSTFEQCRECVADGTVREAIAFLQPGCGGQGRLSVGALGRPALAFCVRLLGGSIIGEPPDRGLEGVA